MSRAAIRELAAQRVEAAWTCLSILRPDLALPDKKALATQILDLCRGGGQTLAKRIEITPAQVQEIVWRNSQCVNHHCSMLLFSRELADELNEFFKPEE
jgi:hypothetical protein